MAKKMKITPEGPYLLDEGIPIRNAIIDIDIEGTSQRWRDGKEYLTSDEPVALCRCGHSKNKPFCDGTHVTVGFIGAEKADRQPYLDDCKRYEGAEVDLLDNENLCASMRFCDRGIGVWDAAINSDDDDNRALAIEETAACASGRLTVVDKAGQILEADLPLAVSPVQDTAAGRRGPLWVKGGIELESVNGQVYEVRNRMTLCRCGHSKNMPFCDISHMNCTHMEGFDE